MGVLGLKIWGKETYKRRSLSSLGQQSFTQCLTGTEPDLLATGFFNRNSKGTKTDPSPRREINIVVLGAGGVGKSCLTGRFISYVQGQLCEPNVLNTVYIEQLCTVYTM